jgi:hypothetical protein
MAVPSTIADLSVTASDNSPSGSEPIGTALDNYIRAHGAFIAQLEANKADDSFLQSGTGAAATTIQEKQRESVSAADFAGFDKTGATDSTTAVSNACASLGAAGGNVIIPTGAKVLIDNNLTIPANVSLVGPHKFVGTPGSNSSAAYGSVGGALIINSIKTITLSSGSSLSGLLMYRKGMTFPAADASAFAGTAITIGGDDAAVERCQILGFNKAIYSSGYQRPRFGYIYIDCQNGIDVTNCYDIPDIESVHCWPFSTIATFASGGIAAVNQRTGTAFYLHDVADWVKLSNCFSYAYKYGYDISSVNSPTLVSCAVDGTSGADIISGSRGFQVRGTTNDAKLIGCQAASQEIGFYNDSAANVCNHYTNCIAWSGSTHGFYFGAGDATVHGGSAYNVPSGVTYTNAASRVLLSGVYFGATNALPINSTVAAKTDKLIIKNPIFSSTADGSSPFSGMGGTLTAPSIASAGQLNIPATGEEFIITGTTGIGNIHEGWAGRQITLVFSGALTVVHGTGSASAVKLNSASNFVTAANSTLTLKHNGTQWYEIGRSA